MDKRTDRDPAPARENHRQTWNSPEQIAEHRAMTPEQRLRKTIKLSRAAIRFSQADRASPTGHLDAG